MALSADPVIVRARLASAPAVVSPVTDSYTRLLSLWAGLTAALAAYDAATISSLSSEGVSRTMAADQAGKVVAEWLVAYETETAAADLPEDADPNLLGTPLGHTVTYSAVPLRF